MTDNYHSELPEKEGYLKDKVTNSLKLDNCQFIIEKSERCCKEAFAR